MSATVKDVMTAKVIAIRKDTSFKEIAASLRKHRVSAFPVVDEDRKVIGVVSEADLLTKEALVAGAGLQAGPISGLLHRKELWKAGAVTAADLMTKPPVTVDATEPVTHAARLMYSSKVKRLPVVDETGQLVGIVSRADVLNVYSRPDADIEHDIAENVILKMFLADPARFTVTVSDGIVTLSGRPETVDCGRDIVAETWHVEGVVSVRDRLDYPPPEHVVDSPGPLF